MKIGSSAKAMIDSSLFKFKPDANSIKCSLEALNEFALEWKIKNSQDYYEQIENNGDSIIPGVKDWYTPRKNGTDEEIIFACQKENLWWNKKLSRKYIIVLAVGWSFIFIAVFIIAGIVGVSLMDTGILVAFSLPFWLKIFNEIKEFYVYEVSHSKAFKVVEIMEENEASIELITSLQKEIDMIRRSGFLVPNYFHKIDSLKLHKLLYDKIRADELNVKS